MRHVYKYAEVSAFLEANPNGVLYFTTSTCQPCKAVKPILEKMEREGLIAVAQIDAERAPELAERYGVHSVPYILFYRRGHIWKLMMGKQSEEALRKALL